MLEFLFWVAGVILGFVIREVLNNQVNSIKGSVSEYNINMLVNENESLKNRNKELIKEVDVSNITIGMYHRLLMDCKEKEFKGCKIIPIKEK